ncbi:type I 3-dehydroquinate dehydratase [Leptospira semungkisensis]|uniref:3-dehydroquinate dehydratase n=1 Tax=Leptospira semungkisensis TaxID=2484985 RepID=A0A4R9G6R0_9LEPT|nr:type I 3-dehydroquinate dehydratase [Leptospira semungkisensis]TGK07133.1 type I 3-dehydroquinate dehydratase [Leptospira semungkisensis]
MASSSDRKIYIVLTLNEEEFFGLEKKPAADFLEIRLDQFSSRQGNAEKILNQIEKLNAACVLTYRQPEDSSLKSVGLWDQDSVQPLINGLESEKHYIDLELDKDNSVFTNLDESRFGIIRSVHNFSAAPNREELLFYLGPVMEEVLATHKSQLPFQRIFKVAALAKSETEAKDFLDSCSYISSQCAKLNMPIGFCGILMGEAGKEYRIFPEKIGSQFTYCCLGEPKAPGQVDLKTLLEKRSK